jgi:hypothetical protein
VTDAPHTFSDADIARRRFDDPSVIRELLSIREAALEEERSARAAPKKAQKSRAMPLTHETLLTLEDACEIYFGGAVTPATLKAESSRGNLHISKIGRGFFTTLADLKKMRELCRVETQAQDSGTTKRAERGRSSTGAGESARAALRAKLQKHSKPSPTTSRAST